MVYEYWFGKDKDASYGEAGIIICNVPLSDITCIGTGLLCESYKIILGVMHV